MVDLTTTYLGLKLHTPLVVSSNPLGLELENLHLMAVAGAGAIVLPSLFAEQLTLEDSGFSYYLPRGRHMLPEGLRHIPDMREHNKGAGGYLAYVYQAKKVVDVPVIASLNGISKGGWIRYARMLESAGADAIELNMYYLPTETHLTSTSIERMYLETVQAVVESVTIPVAVKLNPYFSALPHMAQALVDRGVQGLVLFNRFYQPDIDLDSESVTPNLVLSTPEELRLRLRWAAILYGRVTADLAITGGVHSGADAIKAILAGASVAMVTSAILIQGIDHLTVMRSEMRAWLEEKNHASLGVILGKLSQRRVPEPGTFERANYMQVLQSYRGHLVAAASVEENGAAEDE